MGYIPNTKGLEKSRNKSSVKKGLVSLIVTILLFSVISYAPTAAAVSVAVDGITSNQAISQSGAPLTFNVTINIAAGERIPVTFVNIVLDNQTIQFTPTGTQVVPPGGTYNQAIPSIILLSASPETLYDPAYGYGYGSGDLSGFGFSYGYGYSGIFGYGINASYYGVGFGLPTGATILMYSITLFPSQLSPGPHTIRADASITPDPATLPGSGFGYFSSDQIPFYITFGGGGGGSSPDYILSAASPSFTLSPGQNSNQTLTLTSLNNYASNITFSAISPPGLNILLNGANPSTVTSVLGSGATVNLVLTTTVSSNAPPISNNFQIIGNSLSNETKVLNLVVNVIMSGQTSLTVSPLTATAGGSLTFTAVGFDEGESLTLRMRTPPTYTFQTLTPTSYGGGSNSVQSGTWSATITIPTSVPQGQFETEVEGATSGKRALVFITIVGTGDDFMLQLSPSNLDLEPTGVSGQASTSITVTSINDFAQSVVLSVDSASLPSYLNAAFSSSSTVSTTAGASSSPITLNVYATDQASPGPNPIRIIGTSSGSPPIIHELTLNVYIRPPSGFNFASMYLTPILGSNGDSITVTGNGFPTSTVGTILFAGASVGTPTTNSNGGFTTSITVPSSLAAGSYPVDVMVGSMSAMASFQIVGAEQKFSISVSPSSISPITPGSNTTVTIQVVSINSQTPNVTLSAVGLPPSISATFGSNVLQPSAGGSKSTTLTLIASTFTPSNMYNFNINAQSASEYQSIFVNFGVMSSSNFNSQFGLANIFLSPSYGAINSTVTMTGTGFNNANSLSSFMFGPTTVNFTSAVTVSGGAFTAMFKVPSPNIQQGAHYPITVQAGGSTALAHFDVTSSSGKFQFSVSPSNIPPIVPGDSVNVTATLTSLNQQTPTISVAVRGLPTFISTTQTAPMVNLSAGQTRTITIMIAPSALTPPGPYDFSVEATSGTEVQTRPVFFGIRGSDAFFSQFGFASLSLSPKSGARGDSVTLSGSGFDDASTITSFYFGPQTITFDTPVTVTSGSFTAVVTVPTTLSQGGMYPVDVSAGTKTAGAPFKVVSSNGKFTMTVTPQGIPPILPGGNANVSVTITAINQQSPTVTLSVDGLPPDISSSFTNTTLALLPGQSKTSTLTVTASATAYPGPADFAIGAETTGEKQYERIFFGVRPPDAFFTQFGFASLSVNPTSGAKGDQVSVTGSGFTGVASIPSIGFGPETITFTTPVTVSSGSFSATIKVPTNTTIFEGGMYPVYVDVNNIYAEAPFMVIGSSGAFTITVTPQGIPPILPGGNANVTVTITSANQQSPTVTLSVDGLPQFISSSFTNTTLALLPGQSLTSTLTVAASATAPPGPADFGIKAVSGSDTQFRKIYFGVMPPFAFFTQFSFAQVNVNPLSAGKGEQITVTGSGFTGVASIPSIGFGPETITFSSAVTVTNGAFSATMKVPTNTSIIEGGMYPIFVDANGIYGEVQFHVIKSGGTFAIIANPPFIPPISPGENTTLAINVESLNQASGNVTLAVYGLPPSITATLSSSIVTMVPGQRSTVTLSITVGAVTPPGPYDFAVEGISGTEMSYAEVHFGVMPPSNFNTQFGFGSISLNPNFGSKGDQVTVTGSGFTDASSIPSIQFGPETITFSSAVTVTSGAFSAVIKVPTNATIIEGGIYPVEVNVGGLIAMTPFKVDRSSGTFHLKVSPQFLAPSPQGSTVDVKVSVTSVNQQSPTVTLSALGLPPSISASFSNSTIVLLPGSTQSVTLTLTIGAIAPPGPYPFDIVGTAGSEINYMPMGFGVMPKSDYELANIQISPNFGDTGTKVTISGSGFSDASTVTAVQLGPSTITFTTAVTVTNGAFSATIKVPTTVGPGFHPVTVSAGTKSDTKHFEVVGSNESFFIDASPPFVGPILQGLNGTTKISVTSLNNQNPNVTLSIVGLPPGITGALDNSILSVTAGGTQSATLTLSVSLTTSPGGYHVGIIATSGTSVKSIGITVGVMPKTGVGQGYASLILTPPVGRPGDQISLSGNGYTGGANITLSVKPMGAPTATTLSTAVAVTADSNGEWSVSVVIPSGVGSGDYEIQASDGTKKAFAPLHVIPSSGADYSIKLSPQYLRVARGSADNTTLTLKSANAFNSSVQFLIEPLPPGISVAFLTTNGTVIGNYTGSFYGNLVYTAPIGVAPTGGGSLSITVNVKAASDAVLGPVPVMIRVDLLTSSLSRAKLLEINVVSTATSPSISLSSSVGAAGSDVSLRGTSFGDSETINIYWARSTTKVSTIPSTITTDSSGVFSATFTIPTTSNAGTYPIEAVGQTSGKRAAGPFTVIPTVSSSFMVYVSPRVLHVPSGGSSNFTITVQPVGSFASSVTVNVTGLPTGASVTYSPASSIIPSVGTPATITVTLASSTASQENTWLNVTATSTSPSINTSSRLLLKINPPTTTPTFNMNVGPDILLTQGGSTSAIYVNIFGINSFTSEVSLSTSVATSSGGSSDLGVTLASSSVTPSSITGVGSVQVTVTAGSSTVVGTHTITVTGTSGSISRSAILQITVSESSGTSYSSAPVLPSRITEDTPMPVSTASGDTLSVQSITSSSAEAVTIDMVQSTADPSDLGTTPSGTTSASTNITSIQSSQPLDGAAAVIALNYNATLLTELGLNPSNITIAYLALNGTWVALSTVVDTTGQTATATITHFSAWSIFSLPTTTTTTTGLIGPVGATTTATTTATATSTATTTATTATTSTTASTTSTVTLPPQIARSVTTPITQSSFTIDDSLLTGVKVRGEGVTYTQGEEGSIMTANYDQTPTTSISLSGATGKAPIKYIDVLAQNVVSGTITVTMSFALDEVRQYNLATLTLLYYEAGTWKTLTDITLDIASGTISGSIDVTKLTGTIIVLGATPPATVTTTTPVPTTTTTTGSTSTLTTTTIVTQPGTVTETVTDTPTVSTTTTETSIVTSTDTAISTVTSSSTETQTDTQTTTTDSTVRTTQTDTVDPTSISTSTATITSTESETETITKKTTKTETELYALDDLSLAAIVIAILLVAGVVALIIVRRR